MEAPPATPASAAVAGPHAHHSAAAAAAALPTIGTALRPVIFVVDATHPTAPGAHHAVDDGEEPFDVRRTSLVAASDDGGLDVNESLYDTLLSVLQGKPLGSNDGGNSAYDEDLSVSASFASSAPPFSPGSGTGNDGDGIGDNIMGTPPPPPSNKRFMSPFSRIRVGRWKQSSPGALDDNDIDNNTPGTSSHHHALAKDMEEDPDDHTTATDASSNSDNVSTALSSYSKDNPPVHFMSKRARVVAVSRRHAFPPSKFPKGKMDDVNGGGSSMLGEVPSSHGGNSWLQSYDIQQEGILPSGWLEKHARALPSAVVVVATLNISNDDARRVGMRNAVRAVEDLRMTLAEKRSVPIHLVCLMREEGGDKKSSKKNNSTQQKLNAIKEKICQECYLPQSQVFLLKYPVDMEPDEFETGIMKSPYLNTGDNPLQQQSTEKELAERVMMNPLLRQLDRSLRDTSALYYSRLAEAQEQKLMLWRNRYHNTNASFEVNTLMAAMRCARYAMKVGTLREFQMRTGGAGAPGQSGGGSGGRWTDKGSSVMMHYDEAYRWVTELHRRAVAWRVASLSSSTAGTHSFGSPTFPSPAPITPRYSMMDEMASPKLTESPGGGIGVELSLPGAVPPPPIAGFTPPPPGPPPMRRNSPVLTSQKGYNATENIAFFALLWEQCRAVASILNAKLLRSVTSHGWTEEQWSRHRLTFLAPLRGIPNFDANGNDDFFGPAWHRFLYLVEELGTFACVAEGRWRRLCSAASSPRKNNPTSSLISPSYHQIGAPWKAYGELCEAMLGLRKVVQNQLRGFGSCDWSSVSTASSGLLGRRKFVGSIVGGDSGLGSMGWQFENESKRDHRGIALYCIHHALDLLDENTSLCNSGRASVSPNQPSASARLHYLAARLLMSLHNPTGAIVHLKIAAGQTKTWPSLHLSIQRALLVCEERCKAAREASIKDGLSPLSSVEDVANKPVATSKDSSIEVLMRADSCKLLSPKEMADAQKKAWEDNGESSSPREILWKHDNISPQSKPPFEFAVSFLKSTHATSSDTVTGCVSIKSCLDFEVCVESMQILTTSGTYDVSTLEQPIGEKENALPYQSTAKRVPNQGVQFNTNDLAYFLTEICIPSNLSNVAPEGSSADISKFIPKNGRLCNMGLSHAAGNICESRFDNSSGQKISINGKAIAISTISETCSSFLGGIPLVCHGVVLTLKLHSGSPSSLKLHLESPRLISPLLRPGMQRLAMEECNYMAHSWSRPAHHPWCLGPRVLRVLGPRPRMQVTNLTDSLTGCKAVEGTVNRIMFKLKAGRDEDCWDVRVRLLCVNLKKSHLNNESANDATTPEGGSSAIAPHRMPTFVQQSADTTGNIVMGNGVALPQGWEPRTDVGTDQSHHATTTICPHLGAGKSLIYALDIYCPLGDQSSQESNGRTTCSTYDLIVTYRQIRTGKGNKQNSNEVGDQVMVMQSGSVEWIPPFIAEFSQTNGSKKPYPCGIPHPSNTLETAPSSSIGGPELIAADGDCVQMRCSLEAKGIGSNNAASILCVSNESDPHPLQRVLYSPDSGIFMNQTKQGSKLSLSYSIYAQKDAESNNNGVESIYLGVISVDWKPSNLPPLNIAPKDSIAIEDDFGLNHGPLSLPTLAPMIFHGPACQVLHAPFKAKLLKCPSTLNVGTPFCLSYQVTNLTAKCQMLSLCLEVDEASKNNSLQLLAAGKLKEEMQMAPFEEKTFSFTFISMMAGKILRPPLTISSGRHQAWVINETSMSSRYLFVMP